MTPRFGPDRWLSFKTFWRLSLERELRRGFGPFLSRFGEARFGLILNDDNGKPSEAAETVLRAGEVLAMAEN